VSIDRTGQRQAGVIAHHQAVRLGLTARTVQRRARSGAWQELLARVYLVSGPAAVTGQAAAYWHVAADS
jgi:hypothetical protein